jgi:hypothetical protein
VNPAFRQSADLIVEGTRVFGGDEDEQLRLKIRYVDMRPAREWVIARQSDDDRFAPECLIDETRIGSLRPDEPDIDLSVEQCMPLLHRPQVLQSEVDVREAPPEHSNHVGERPVGRGDQVADDEFAEFATLGALCGEDGALGLGKGLPRLREKCLPGRREFDPSLCPTKQAGAEFILKAPYLLAQRRLRDVKPRGGAAEMQLLGDSEKGAEVSQLHPGIISREISGRISRVRIDIGPARFPDVEWSSAGRAVERNGETREPMGGRAVGSPVRGRIPDHRESMMSDYIELGAATAASLRAGPDSRARRTARRSWRTLDRQSE